MNRLFIVFLFLVPLPNFGQKLFFLQDNVQGQKDFVVKNHLDTYTMINQDQFVTKDLLDDEKLKQEIIRRFPKKSSSGLAVLDWEGKGMESLVGQSDSDLLDKYINEFVRALKIAKHLRPNVKWAFYALPFRQYWNISNSFKEKNYKLSPIIQYQDFIAPSLYIFYPEEVAKTSNKEYIQKNVSLALEMGKKYKKPVYPFIWQRVHPSNKNYGEHLVPLSVFEDEIGQITKTAYSGSKVSGLLWWHCENYSYLNRAKSKVHSREYAIIKDANLYQKDMFQRYFDSIKKYLDK